MGGRGAEMTDHRLEAAPVSKRRGRAGGVPYKHHVPWDEAMNLIGGKDALAAHGVKDGAVKRYLYVLRAVPAHVVLPIVQKRMAEGGDLAQDHRAMRIPTVSKIVERLVSLYDKTGGEGPAWQVVADVVDRALELADATRP